MKKKVLIFGATGEIGGRIARLCADAGHKVLGVSRGQNKREMVDLSGIEMLAGNKRDEPFIRDVCAKRGVDVVVDSVPSAEDVTRYRKYFVDVANLLFCGSTGKFVPLQYLPADENHPWREKTPVNFHRQSLLDAFIMDLWASQKFPATIFCPTNIIGEHRVPLELWGGRDIGFFRKLKAGEPIMIAPCEHILLQSGYNWDLARAFANAVDRPDAIRGETFIISCKRAITLGRYLRCAMDFLNSKSEIAHTAPEKLQDIYPGVTMAHRLDFLLEHMCFDIAKAERALDYAPTHTAEQGLIKALEWCEAAGLL